MRIFPTRAVDRWTCDASDGRVGDDHRAWIFLSLDATHPGTRFGSPTTCPLVVSGRRCTKTAAWKSSKVDATSHHLMPLAKDLDEDLDTIGFPCVFLSIRIRSASNGPHRGIFSLGVHRLILASFVGQHSVSVVKWSGFQTLEKGRSTNRRVVVSSSKRTFRIHSPRRCTRQGA